MLTIDLEQVKYFFQDIVVITQVNCFSPKLLYGKVSSAEQSKLVILLQSFSMWVCNCTSKLTSTMMFQQESSDISGQLKSFNTTKKLFLLIFEKDITCSKVFIYLAFLCDQCFLKFFLSHTTAPSSLIITPTQWHHVYQTFMYSRHTKDVFPFFF